MRILFFIGLFFFSFLISCTGGNSAQNDSKIEEMKEVIVQKEDSLSLLQKQNKPIPKEKHFELIQALSDFYLAFPKDKYAPVCLDKIQMSYSGLGVYHRAIEYADVLIKKYPKYINRPMILESQASNYDIFQQPRDTVKVRYYYELLLKENPNLDKDKKEGIIMRLDHLDLTFDQYIDFISNLASSPTQIQPKQ
jgi:hypothetical protein